MPWIDPERYDVVQYYVGWFVLCLLALYVFRQIYSKLLNETDSKAQVVTQSFKSFQRMFVVVYLIMMAADWVQGPYVYALYKIYGYDKGQIGILFIAGFGSSLVFGTVVGSLADKYGRKRSCLTFGVFYSLSCLTKHSPDFNVLLLGRILGGVSTSILFSAFESWMVHEHHDAAYPEEWLGITFSLATAGNGIIAIASGVVAGVVRDAFGPVAPFDLSLLLLVVGSVVVATNWKENYGDSNVNVLATFTNGFGRIFEDKKVLYLGISQSFFEGTMYIFVFMWTDALASTSTKEILHGWIFATFMVCVLLGSNIFNVLLKMGIKVERFTVHMFLTAGLALLVPALVQNHSIRMLAFCVFETCCGMFWPSLGFMRSRYVPEEVRATVMNVFRIPLNLIVVVVLVNIGTLPESTVFFLCVALLCVAIYCQQALIALTVDSTDAAKKSKVRVDLDELGASHEESNGAHS